MKNKSPAKRQVVGCFLSTFQKMKSHEKYKSVKDDLIEVIRNTLEEGLSLESMKDILLLGTDCLNAKLLSSLALLYKVHEDRELFTIKSGKYEVFIEYAKKDKSMTVYSRSEYTSKQVINYFIAKNLGLIIE